MVKNDILDMTKDATQCVGGSVPYYKLKITNPVSSDTPYTVECLDIIECLDMNFAEGEAFKALWRMAAARTLNMKKEGYDLNGLYDAEKVEFYGHRLVIQAKIRLNDLKEAIDEVRVARTVSGAKPVNRTP